MNEVKKDEWTTGKKIVVGLVIYLALQVLLVTVLAFAHSEPRSVHPPTSLARRHFTAQARRIAPTPALKRLAAAAGLPCTYAWAWSPPPRWGTYDIALRKNMYTWGIDFSWCAGGQRNVNAIRYHTLYHNCCDVDGRGLGFWVFVSQSKSHGTMPAPTLRVHDDWTFHSPHLPGLPDDYRYPWVTFTVNGYGSITGTVQH